MVSKNLLFTLLSFVFISLFIPAALAQEPQPNLRFGLVDAYLDSPAATYAGAGYTRITLRWDLIQPYGRDDWKPANVPDPLINGELQAGREVVAVLVGTPAWAAQGNADPRAVPDMEAWGAFTKRIGQQYQGRIRHWIIWDTPDVWDPESQASTWLGTEADYLALLKSAYSNLKQVDPEIQVHLAGLTYHWDAQHGRPLYLSRLLSLITADPEAAKHNYYFDAVSYHLYHNPLEMAGIITQTHVFSMNMA